MSAAALLHPCVSHKPNRSVCDSVAICDVLADAMVAEYAKLEKGHGAGNLQVAVFGSNNMGQILLNFFAGDVLEWVGPWPMFVCFGILQAGIAGIAMILNETPDEEEVTWPKVKRQLTLLKKTLVYPPIYMPAIFFYLIKCVQLPLRLLPKPQRCWLFCCAAAGARTSPTASCSTSPTRTTATASTSTRAPRHPCATVQPTRG